MGKNFKRSNINLKKTKQPACNYKNNTFIERLMTFLNDAIEYKQFL